MLAYTLLFIFNIVTVPIYLLKHRNYLIINVIPLWIMMAFRGITVGSDTPVYKNIFNQSELTEIPMNFVNWLFPIHEARFENGFLLLEKTVYKISPDFRFMLIITTTIMLCCLIFFIVRLKVNYIIAILVYESMFMPFFMNSMRQALAISFCMVAFVFLMENRIGYFLIFNFLAITMHATAWLFLLTLIYKYLKQGWKSKVLLILLTMIISFSFETIYGRVAEISEEANTFSGSVINNNTNGFLNIIFSVSLAILVYIWFYHYTRVFKIEKEGLVTNTKLLLLTVIAFYIVALKFSQLSRIAIYFTIGYYPALSLLAGGIDLKKSRNVICIIVCTFLIAYFVFIQTFRPEWSNIVPYYIM